MPRFRVKVAYTFDREVEVEAEGVRQAQMLGIDQAPLEVTVLGTQAITARRAVHGFWDAEVEEIKEDDEG